MNVKCNDSDCVFNKEAACILPTITIKTVNYVDEPCCSSCLDNEFFDDLKKYCVDTMSDVWTLDKEHLENALSFLHLTDSTKDKLQKYLELV